MKKLLFFASLVVFTTAFTQPRGWKFIADKIVQYGPDRDVVVVNGRDAFSKIAIRVTDAPLNMIDMDVYFENGEKFNVPIKMNFRQGEESRPIDLPGGIRRIDHITFLYDTQGTRHGKARVSIWGKK